ncbi:FCD domain-containing protein [Rhizobiales bacterium RZME27]|uniref:FCD domain-containing protein n=1 Tax=Endobacterium cereale TaxID=2663029 RepID=A0A6A8AC22_9HYPH|nr:GntR family transcriptional regulator [Endobacterium cereale]MEB2843915.1 GntR family transcriptional regulator [Endobacterium cereale]MQY46301.1 FCD domain-containing protein [Endobacterium cereale]
MKTNALFKRSYNQALDMLAGAGEGVPLPSEPAMAATLGVSRTTVRAVLTALAMREIITIDGRAKTQLRLPKRNDYLADADLEPLADMVERKFMAWLVGPDCSPGHVINGLDLARQFGVSTSAIRDCLNKFSHFGLLERQSNGRWRTLGLTVEFVAELFDMRELIEFRAVDRFVALSKDDPLWSELSLIEKEHHAFLDDFDRRNRDFSDLDHRFHKLVDSAVPNRFLGNIQGVMSVIFHYHYQWNKKDEVDRNHRALCEHLAYIDGLKSGDPSRAREACRLHLHTARSTMLTSINVI